MTLTIGEIARSNKTYVAIDESDFLYNKTSFEIKHLVKNLSGMSRYLLNKKIKVKEISPETNPEYFI